MGAALSLCLLAQRTRVAALRPALTHGGREFSLALLPPDPAEHEAGGGQGAWVLPIDLPAPHVVDLVGLSPASTTMLLADLAARRQADDPSTLFVIEPHNRCVQRLVASSGQRCVAYSSDADPGLMLCALDCIAVGAPQMWIGMTPPPPPFLPPAYLGLLAALWHAPNFDIAAAWCYLERTTAWRMRKRAMSALGLQAMQRCLAPRVEAELVFARLAQ